MNWSAVTSVITAMTAIGALVFTALSLNATRDQVAIAEQGQFTDRYSRAIEQLGQQGPDRLQIRLGAIYALERLAHDSPRDQPTIIEVLTTFVRTSVDHAEFSTDRSVRNPLRPPLCPPGRGSPSDDAQESPSADVQAALTVLGRRDVTHDNGATVDLSYACLRYVDLGGANLADANLSGADLTGATLREANLVGAALLFANLTGAYLDNANLHEADLIAADLTKARLNSANLTESVLGGATLHEALLQEADLRGASLAVLRGPATMVQRTDLRGANFSGADLRGVYLEEVEHDTFTRMEQARTDHTTRGKWW